MKRTIVALAVAGLAFHNLEQPHRPAQFYIEQKPPCPRLKKNRFKFQRKGKK